MDPGEGSPERWLLPSCRGEQGWEGRAERWLNNRWAEPRRDVPSGAGDAQKLAVKANRVAARSSRDRTLASRLQPPGHQQAKPAVSYPTPVRGVNVPGDSHMCQLTSPEANR